MHAKYFNIFSYLFLYFSVANAYFTNQKLDNLYDAIQGKVTKLSVQHYLSKEGMGSKHELTEKEILFIIEKLPNHHVSNEDFKRLMLMICYTQEQLDEIYAGAKSHVDEAYDSKSHVFSWFKERPVTRASIRSYWSGNISKYGLSSERISIITEHLPVGCHITNEEFRNLMKCKHVDATTSA